MKKTLNFLLVGFALLVLNSPKTTAQPLAKFSLECRAGIPAILAYATPEAAPFGGLGFRYAFNDMFSVSANTNGGVLAGRDSKGYFRNSFLTYGVQGQFNISSFFPNRSETWKKVNFYAGIGASNMRYFYTFQYFKMDSRLSREHFLYEAGLSMRYYLNEMVDLTAAANFYFSQTEKLDQVFGNGINDKLALTSVGIAIKFLPYERKQHADWQHIDINYTTSSMELAKNLIATHDKDMHDFVRSNNDSLANVLRGEIKAVDEKVNTVTVKVDTVDAKLNQILDLLNKMNTVPPTAVKGGKGKNNSKNTKAGAKGNKVITSATNNTADTAANAQAKPTEAPVKLNYITPDGAKIKAAVIDPAQVKENYAIVVASFAKDQNAINERDKYIAKGWDSHILGTPKSPLKRVVIFSNNYFEAAKIVTELRQTGKPDVWMLDVSTGKGVYIK
jgi:hypothetical protein